MHQKNLNELEKLRKEIQYVIRSHPNGCITPLQLKIDLKRYANLRIDEILQDFYGKSASILDVIHLWKEFKLIYRGTNIFIGVCQSDHIHEMNKSAKVSRLGYNKKNSSYEEKNEIIVIKAPDPQFLFTSSSNESLLDDIMISQSQKDLNEPIEKMREILKNDSKTDTLPNLSNYQISLSRLIADEASKCSIKQHFVKPNKSSDSFLSRENESIIFSEQEKMNLLKLKRFLKTLIDKDENSSGIIRELIVLLASGGLTIRQFKKELQEAASVPLNVSGISSMRLHLALLRRQLNNLAQANNQSLLQFIVENQNLVFEESHLDLVSENGLNENIDSQSKNDIDYTLFENFLSATSDSNKSIEEKSIETQITDQNDPPKEVTLVITDNNLKNQDEADDSKTKDNYLDKLKKSKIICIKNDMKIKEFENCSNLKETSRDKNNNALKYHYNCEQTVSTLINEIQRQAEDLITEIIRNAEDSILKVKREAFDKIQKAVDKVKNQEVFSSFTQTRIQFDIHDRCWNCGRLALEKCSGCLIACYCSYFCQSKDWITHREKCGNHTAQI